MKTKLKNISPSRWNKTEIIVHLMFLNILYLSAIFISTLLLAQSILVFEYLKLESRFPSVLTCSVLILTCCVSLVGLALSSLTIYKFYRKFEPKKNFYFLFLVVLVLTEILAVSFTVGLLIITLNAEDVLKSLYTKCQDMIVENFIVYPHNSLLKCRWCWNDKMKNLLSPDIVKKLKVYNILNKNTTNILAGIQNIAITMSLLLFVTLNYLCIGLIVIVYKQFLIKKSVIFV